MSINEKLLSVTDDNDLNPDISTRTESKIVSSDREVLPDELSTDHGEGHGKGKGGPKASIFGSAMNIANTIMGAGILALPNVISQFGIVLGSIIITIACVLTYISCVLLLKAKNLSHHSKYISIGKHCFGAKGLWAVKVIIIVNNVGLCIAYLIIFATVAQNLISGFAPECTADSTTDTFYCQSWFLSLIAAILVLPLVFARSMTKLQGASAIAVLAASIFSIITIEHFFEALSRGENSQEINILPNVSNIPAALASVTSVFLAFTFQFNFFPVYKTLHNPSDSRMKKTTGFGLILVLIIYLSVANCGYLTFGDNSQNLLSNFTKDTMGMTTFVIINVAFLISATLTLPLMFFGAKNEIYGVIKLIRRHIVRRRLGNKKVEQTIESNTISFEPEREVEPENEDDEKVIERKYGFKGFGFNVYIAILFCIIVLLAIVLPGINVVFSFVGSTAANGLNFLLPPLFYLSLASKKGKLRPIAIGILSLGAVMGVVGIISSALTPAT